MARKTKILFFASNPDDTKHLFHDEEAREIRRGIQASGRRDALELGTLGAVRPGDLLEELNAERPVIVHFSGHGGDKGALLLMNDEGLSTPVSPTALKAVFKAAGGGVQLVVINACRSGALARSVAQVVGCAIGMREPVPEANARTFAAEFYRAIAFSRSVQEAFDQAKAAVLVERLPQTYMPVLHVRAGIDPRQVVPVAAAPPDFVDRICGDWWGRVSTAGHESALACIRIAMAAEQPGVAVLQGRSFTEDGELVAKWGSVFAHVAGYTSRNRIEFRYLYEGERHDRPDMTLLFGHADMAFEIPTSPDDPILRAESAFVSVYRAAKVTTHTWGNATRRVQDIVRAQDGLAFEKLWTAVSVAQRARVVNRILGAVFGLSRECPPGSAARRTPAGPTQRDRALVHRARRPGARP